MRQLKALERFESSKSRRNRKEASVDRSSSQATESSRDAPEANSEVSCPEQPQTSDLPELSASGASEVIDLRYSDDQQPPPKEPAPSTKAGPSRKGAGQAAHRSPIIVRLRVPQGLPPAATPGSSGLEDEWEDEEEDEAQASPAFRAPHPRLSSGMD